MSNMPEGMPRIFSHYSKKNTVDLSKSVFSKFELDEIRDKVSSSIYSALISGNHKVIKQELDKIKSKIGKENITDLFDILNGSSDYSKKIQEQKLGNIQFWMTQKETLESLLKTINQRTKGVDFGGVIRFISNIFSKNK